MNFRFRTLIALFLALSLAPFLAPGGMPSVRAQDKSAHERIVREIESRGFTNVTGIRRRGSNYVFQASDFLGNRVRVVMNAETGEIVGLSKGTPEK